MCPEQSAPEHVRSLEARLVSCRTTLFVRYRPRTARQYHAKPECKLPLKRADALVAFDGAKSYWPRDPQVGRAS